MKYIKTFEDIEDMDVFKYNYYLNKEDNELIEVYILDFLRNKNILKKINRLRQVDFDKGDVNYDSFNMFINLISSNTYNSDNIYYYIDSKIKDIKGRFPTVKLRNSMQEIFERIYNDSIKEKIDKKLISILEKKPDEYSDIYENYFDELSDEVKKACAWMLGYKKFNL